MGLRAILDHPKVMALRDFHHRVEVRGMAVQMHGNDSHRARRDRRFDQFRVDAVGVVDIDKRGLGAAMEHRLD